MTGKKKIHDFIIHILHASQDPGREHDYLGTIEYQPRLSECVEVADLQEIVIDHLRTDYSSFSTPSMRVTIYRLDPGRPAREMKDIDLYYLQNHARMLVRSFRSPELEQDIAARVFTPPPPPPPPPPNLDCVLFKKEGLYYTCFANYSVVAPPNATVRKVLELLKEEACVLPQYTSVTVYEIIGEYKGIGQISLKEAEEKLPLDAKSVRNHRPLLYGSSVKEGSVLGIVFDEKSHDKLHIIYEDPTNYTREEIAEFGRKRKPPSEDAMHTERIKTQKNIGAIYDERPGKKTGLPIAIYHPVFAKFLSRASADFEGDEGTLHDTTLFINASRDYYPTEGRRTAALQSSLKILLHDAVLTETILNIDADRRIIPDGVIQVKLPRRPWLEREPVCFFTEVKNEVGAGGCDPALQCQSDYVKVYSSTLWKPFWDVSCCPALLLAIAGPHMMVSGAVFAETFVVQRLTDYIALGSHPTEEDKGLRRVAQILVALKECIEDLEKFYKSLEPAPVDPPPSAAASSTARTKSRGQTSGPPRKIFPYYTKYLTKDGEHKFKYTTRLTPLDSPRAVFEAIMESPEVKKVVVKFTRTYCEEAHRLLAEHLLAPELLHHEVIEGTGIHFVVMDYVEVTTKEGALKVESGPEHVGLLRKAIKLLHAQGFVFGDLREPNILIAGAGLKLVDFDWCGKIGEARYPTNINMSEGIPWPDGVRAEGKIEIAHDVTWFRQLTGAEL